MFQVEDGIRELVRSRGLGDVYKRQDGGFVRNVVEACEFCRARAGRDGHELCACLLYTSDADDERSSVDLGGRRIIKKKYIGKKEHVKLPTSETTS